MAIVDVLVHVLDAHDVVVLAGPHMEVHFSLGLLVLQKNLGNTGKNNIHNTVITMRPDFLVENVCMENVRNGKLQNRAMRGSIQVLFSQEARYAHQLLVPLFLSEQHKAHSKDCQLHCTKSSTSRINELQSPHSPLG